MITANKIAITIRDMVFVISKKEVDEELPEPPAAEVGVDVKVGRSKEDDGVGVGLK